MSGAESWFQFGWICSGICAGSMNPATVRDLTAGENGMSTPVVQGMEKKAFDVAWVREQFPSLKLKVNSHTAAFLDGPAGTQVPWVVMEAIQNYLMSANANTYGAFATSQRTNE